MHSFVLNIIEYTSFDVIFACKNFKFFIREEI